MDKIHGIHKDIKMALKYVFNFTHKRNANNYDTISHMSSWQILKPWQYSAGEAVGQSGTHTSLGMQTGITPGNLPISNIIVCIYTSKQKFHLGIYTAVPVPTIQKYICTKLFTVELFITTKSGKRPKCPSIEDWLNQGTYTQGNIKEWGIFLWTD